MRWSDGAADSTDVGLKTLGDSGGQRRLARCGPWGLHGESDLTERLNSSHSRLPRCFKCRRRCFSGSTNTPQLWTVLHSQAGARSQTQCLPWVDLPSYARRLHPNSAQLRPVLSARRTWGPGGGFPIRGPWWVGVSLSVTDPVAGPATAVPIITARCPSATSIGKL